MALADKTCEPCRGGMPPLTGDEIEPLMSELEDWSVDALSGHLRKSVKTGNFMDSLGLANKIGQVAEEQGHHPDLLVRWGELSIELWTHKINGLSEADFILAAKIDRLI